MGELEKLCVALGGLATLGSAIAALVASLRNATKIKGLHDQLNSRLTELVEAVRASAHEAGAKEERERERRSPKGG
jgi:sensor histidine kinase regulating citrate/malate metabolism